MSKLRKLIISPRKFFVDAYFNRYPEKKHRKTLQQIEHSHKLKKQTAVLIGFSDWKTFMVDILPDYNVVFLGHSPRVTGSLLKTIPKFFQPRVFIWSYKFPLELRKICADNGIKTTYVEDGFLRGIGLGVNKTRPLSLVFDDSAMHFDSKKVSELDRLLSSHHVDDTLLRQAESFRRAFANGATKYLQQDSRSDLRVNLNISDEQCVIVVLGQVEDDLSMQYGSNRVYNANDLVQICSLENPEAKILLRPHPESLARKKAHYSNPKDVSHLCDIVPQRYSLRETLEVATRVYTVTSLAGFEALLMGKQVDLFGLPFYGGLGLTNDRHKIPTKEKRSKNRTIDEVLAIVMVKYAKYYHPITSEEITPLEAVEITEQMLATLQPKKKEDEIIRSKIAEQEKIISKCQSVINESRAKLNVALEAREFYRSKLTQKRLDNKPHMSPDQ